MSITTLSSRAFNQDTCEAKNAAKLGPVIITDRRRPARVLLRYDDCIKLMGERTNMPICWPCPTPLRLILS